MSKFKSHKTVEQIAKKHRLDVSFIQKQLDMGEPIEHEHTQDHNLARDIALQHLDEIPDYYTRLKKMEADAKKHYKKFKDVKEHCGCEEKAVQELEDGLKKLDDISYNSIDKLMRRIMKKHGMTAKQLHYAFKDMHNKTPDEWVKAKLNEGLLDWFRSKSKDNVPGWVNVLTGGTCASDEPGEGVPKCVSSEKRASMTTAERRSAARRKKAEDPGQQQKTGAAKPTYVPTDSPIKEMKKEEMDLQEVKDKPGKGSGKKDACYHKVKSRYDVWPSAYASGALVKCRKVGAANWGTKSEATMHEEERYCPLCDKREARSQCSYGEKAWDKVSVKDEEYSMARSELKTIHNAIKRLEQKVGKGEGNLEAWVQSKITKAADYIDTAADYIDSGEMKESLKVRKGILKGKEYQIARSTGAGALSPEAATELGPKAVELRKKKLTQTELPKIKKEENLVDKLTNEILDEKCWTGYKRKKGTTKFAPGSCVKVEDVTIEDSEGNTFAEVVDIIKPEPIKGFKSQIEEATRLQAQTGNVIAVTLSWRAKYYSLKMFFPQVKLPTRKEINAELQKVYPGCNVIHHSVSEIQPGQPLIQAFGPQGGSAAKFGSNKNYVKPMGEEVEISEAKKSEMKCNNPRSEAHGSGETGKSHVVKACEGGKKRLIRFGQLGVKGSPKKKGESKEYASRRRRFQTRHAKNISKGKMSAAYWANKVKW
jgi:hypothetical protein